jgi:hypothetical protein
VVDDRLVTEYALSDFYLCCWVASRFILQMRSFDQSITETIEFANKRFLEIDVGHERAFVPFYK